MLVLFLFLFAKFVQGDDKDEWWEKDGFDEAAAKAEYWAKVDSTVYECILKCKWLQASVGCYSNCDVANAQAIVEGINSNRIGGYEAIQAGTNREPARGH